MRKKTVEIVVAVVVLSLAVVLIWNRSFFVRMDLSAEGRFTLSDVTKGVLSDMSEPLNMNVYLNGDLDANMIRLKRASEDMIEEMNRYSAFRLIVKERFVAEDEYEEMADRGMMGMTVTVRSAGGKMTEQVLFPWIEICSGRDTMLVSLMSPSENESGEVAVNRAIEDLEYQLTDAVRVMNRKGVKRVAFIEGHGELTEEETYDITDELSRYFDVDRGVIGDDASVLDGYAAIIVANPTEKFSEKDKFVIDQYIMNGGGVLWLLDGTRMSYDLLAKGGRTPLVANDVNINDQLFRYGVRVTPTVIEDMQCAYMPVNVSRPGEQPRFEPIPWFFAPLLQTSPVNPITKRVAAVKGDFSSGIECVGEDDNVDKMVILMSGSATHVTAAPSEIDVTNAVKEVPDKYFANGFIPVSVALEGEFESVFKHRMVPEGVMASGIKEKSERTRMVVVADGDVIRNDVERRAEGMMMLPLGYDRVTRRIHGNRDFVMNSILYLTDDEGMMELRKRDVDLRLLNRAKVEKQRTVWTLVNVLSPIAALALFGLIFTIIRRKKYKI